MKRTIVAALLVCGCMTPVSRQNPADWETVQTGYISPTQVQSFTDCLMDGFGKAHVVSGNYPVRQERRTDGYRVETQAGANYILVSADIMFDGSVALYESRIFPATWNDLSGERAAFADCLQRY